MAERITARDAMAAVEHHSNKVEAAIGGLEGRVHLMDQRLDTLIIEQLAMVTLLRESLRQGAVIHWYNWRLSHQGKPDWETLLREITACFGSSAYIDYNVQLSRIRQTSTVVEYQENFEALTNMVHGWLLEALIGAFVKGLRRTRNRSLSDELKASTAGDNQVSFPATPSSPTTSSSGDFSLSSSRRPSLFLLTHQQGGEYSVAKSQILTGSDLPDLADTYNRLSRLAVTLTQLMHDTPVPALVMSGGRSHSSFVGTRGRGAGRGRFQCSYCGKLGHLEDRCWDKVQTSSSPFCWSTRTWWRENEYRKRVFLFYCNFLSGYSFSG
ncbi:hypothetical protein EJ110_NYTH59819 [Nymphaea thermarum]|nr:hypothetical protein EJ110_NYTH59819 [Nymphaea thermarum]